MIVQIEKVLDGATVSALRASLQSASASFQSGAQTAGWHARDVKNNEQLASPEARKTCEVVQAALVRNEIFKAVARPRDLTGMLVSRYGVGMEYGLHVDSPLMAGRRTDLSFTVFLSDAQDYDGGELLIEGNDGTSTIKLAAGSVVVYPSTTLHRVAQVTRGERLVVVGWVRSLIRSLEQREILFDLDRTLRMLRENGASREAIDLTLKTRSNLMRMWIED